MKKRKIFIVEDEALLAMHLEEYLVQENFEVAGISDRAETALNQILVTRPDLVLMDIRLKNGDDGLLLAESLLSHIKLPIIFISGSSDAATLHRVKNVHPYGFLTKPLEEHQLKISIELALSKYQQEQENRYRQELEKITYSLSHSFRSPVASILGLTNLCRLEVKDPQALYYNDLIEKNIKKVDRLLIDYFRFSELSQCRELSVQQVRWDEVWADLFQKVRFREQNENQLPVLVSTLSRPFYTDPEILKTILFPVLKNTLDFRRQGLARVQVCCQEYKNGVRIKILDKGMGMSRDILQNCKELFYRGTEKSGGSGFGLALSWKAVKVLRGSLEIVSKENKGTCVSIFIPDAKQNMTGSSRRKLAEEYE